MEGYLKLSLALLLSAAALIAYKPAAAEIPADSNFGLGVILGEPSGITGKLWFDDTHAADLHLSFDFSDEAFAISSTYLFHFDVIRLKTKAVELPFYTGLGGKMLFDADDEQGNVRADKDDDFLSLGVRVPGGLDLLFRAVPLEIFVEVGIGVRIFPATRTDLDGGLGLRYYF